MRDVNTALSKAYKAAYAGITYNSVAIPAYYGSLPDNINPDNYIVYGQVINNDLSTKNSSDTYTSMQTDIYSIGDKYVSAIISNFIADQVLQRIYSSTQFNLTLGGGLQMFSTELMSDHDSMITMNAGRASISRHIIFRHKIYHGS